jgi:hypothetical protein
MQNIMNKIYKWIQNAMQMNRMYKGMQDIMQINRINKWMQNAELNIHYMLFICVPTRVDPNR